MDEILVLRLLRLLQQSGGRTFVLRSAIVGMNFLSMMALAAVLGLAGFGQLVFLWGLALVAGTFLSLGGPLVLLRGLATSGAGHLPGIVALVIVFPFLLAAAAYGALMAIWPGIPWVAVLVGGLSVNILTCLSSVMRALGSVQWSMALRDAGPQSALLIAALYAQDHGMDQVLILAAGIMALAGAIAALWCLRQAQWSRAKPGSDQRVFDLPLWGTSVLGMAIAQMDLIVGGMLLPAEALGIYALLRRVTNLVALPVSVATWVSAGPIGAAFAQKDAVALQRASRDGSRIALVPGGILFLLGVVTLPILSIMLPGSAPVFAALLICALFQLCLASGFTVATLCNRAHFAALSRLMTLLAYLVATHAFGALTAATNALAYTAAMSVGSLLLWLLLKRDMGLDTSALALLRRREVAWNT